VARGVFRKIGEVEQRIAKDRAPTKTSEPDFDMKLAELPSLPLKIFTIEELEGKYQQKN